MPLFSRRRLGCFYCGKKSIQRYEYGLSKWNCENCLAENYLDANGDITEPPAPTTPSVTRTKRYAKSIPLTTSSTPEHQDGSPFCQTCLNNQFLITQNLANYLPETTDPRYEQFEANLPKYKKELEERYPPVCATCEPRVTERMRAAGNVAKADYLGRMMDKTRRIGLPKDIWTPIFILSTLGGFLWLFSNVVLVIWNGFGALVGPTELEEGVVGDPEDINMLQCIGQAFIFARVDSACANAASGLAGCGIATSLASFWWNPIMRRRNIDRTVGWGEFYKLQTILLAARSGAWYLLRNQEQHGLDPSILRVIHATMLGMNIAVPMLAYSTARIAKVPRISFQDNYRPLSNGIQAKSQTPFESSQAASSNMKTTTTSASINFPFSKVDSTRYSKAEIPPVAPSEDEPHESDAMDIDTPQSKHNFRPTSSRVREPAFQEPSPFYGKIPPAPISQEHRLRNPPNKPSFQKTSSERQEKFFQSMTGRQSDIVEQDPDSPIDFHMQAPKMVTKQDYQETGLEGWFSSNVFSLGEPGTTQQNHQASNSSQIAIPPSAGRTQLQIVPILLLSAAIAAWDRASKVTSGSLLLQFTAAGLGAVVAGTRLATVISGSLINGSDVLLCVVELFGAAALGYQTRQAFLSNLDVREALGSFPLLFFGFMIAQECLVLLTSYRNSQIRVQQQAESSIHQGDSLRSSSKSREKKSLPFDNGAAFLQQNTLSLPSSTPSVREVPSSSNGFAIQSPGSRGLAGLSLGLGNGLSRSNTPSTLTSISTQRTTRVLRGRTPKPWEVGGL